MNQVVADEHAESDIFVEEDELHQIRIVKKYRADVPCVQWLNDQLAKYYDPRKIWPVAQHEYAALTLLAPYGFAPKPVQMRPDAIVMEYAGLPLMKGGVIAARSYVRQSKRILATFTALGFRHNDLLPRNVLVHDGQVKIVDFTLSEFNGIELMERLPDPGWARAGRDRDLLSFKREPPSRLRRLAGRIVRSCRNGIRQLSAEDERDGQGV